MKFVVLFLGCFFVSTCSAATWGYEEGKAGEAGPSQWGTINAVCDGTRQSPINIVTSSATAACRAPPVRVTVDVTANATLTYKNDGHGYTVTGTFEGGKTPTITGGPLGTDVYEFLNFHMHWRSEHTINGRSYPLELHIVHWNKKYPDVATAVTKSDGLAVVGVVFEESLLGRLINMPPRRVFTNSVPIREYTSTSLTEMTDSFPLLEIYSGYNTRNLRIWSYLGSLTVPNCNEPVTWMVATSPIPIYQSELNLLRQIKDSEGAFVSKSNRPVQALNGRTITLYR